MLRMLTADCMHVLSRWMGGVEPHGNHRLHSTYWTLALYGQLKPTQLLWSSQSKKVNQLCAS